MYIKTTRTLPGEPARPCLPAGREARYSERRRVSYNGITSAFQADDRGSIPLTRSKLMKAETDLELAESKSKCFEPRFLNYEFKSTNF